MNNLKNAKIIAYSDGSCKNNGTDYAKGSWAYIIKYDNIEIHSAGYEGYTTNQRMEMLAVINILKEIRKRWKNQSLFIEIFSDSKYVVNGTNNWMFKWERNNWKRSKESEVKNLDLWKQLFSLVNEMKPKICWIKGHSGNTYNELCDDISNNAVIFKADYYKLIRKPANNKSVDI